ncbi:MAG: alpha/beta fold hydrolase [Flammeovirgaceae bacterium]|nr:alpha/beta fold hydrolase [Flammeovirgaceae bacterium]
MKYLLSACLLFFLNIDSKGQYREEEVTFNNGEVTLAGTLSFPTKPVEKHKAIILISGSGPQDRDCNLFGFKSFKILADFFNENGFAVLRCDDRGTGKSSGPSVMFGTSEDLAEDVHQAFLLLKSRPDINSKEIGLLGHSEGGIIAPMVAVQEPSVSFIILMAGFGVKGVEVTSAQQAAILRTSGMSEEFIQRSVAMNRQVIAKMNDPSVSEAELKQFVKEETLKLIAYMPEEKQKEIKDKEVYANMASIQVVQQSKNNWVKFYLNYDPLPTLKQVRCPVLLLFGGLDTQVTAAQNSEIMMNALVSAGNKKVESVTIKNANHLFQEAVIGSPAEYATLKKEFAPEFLDILKKWISQ